MPQPTAPLDADTQALLKSRGPVLTWVEQITSRQPPDANTPVDDEMIEECDGWPCSWSPQKRTAWGDQLTQMLSDERLQMLAQLTNDQHDLELAMVRLTEQTANARKAAAEATAAGASTGSLSAADVVFQQQLAADRVAFQDVEARGYRALVADDQARLVQINRAYDHMRVKARRTRQHSDLSIPIEIGCYLDQADARSFTSMRGKVGSIFVTGSFKSRAEQCSDLATKAGDLYFGLQASTALSAECWSGGDTFTQYGEQLDARQCTADGGLGLNNAVYRVVSNRPFTGSFKATTPTPKP